MIFRLHLVILLFLVICFSGSSQVIEVDFLQSLDLSVNAAGPLWVKTDTARNRVILINTYTSSVTLIAGESHKVENIPIKKRIPQYLKAVAFILNEKTGDIYVIGQNSVHVVFPEKWESVYLPTEKQFEMIAVDPGSGRAFLVGRESKALLQWDPASGKTRRIALFDREEQQINLNATPPPPIRKVIYDSRLQRVWVIDGYTRQLFSLHPQSGKILHRRSLNLQSGARWHFAGYNSETHFLYLVIETDRRRVIQAAKIDCTGENDLVVDLPGLTEGAGITYHPDYDELYIPYDNYPLIHVVDFKQNGLLSEIKIPALGNDATVLEQSTDRLYIASWAYGEIDVVDVKEKRLIRRVRDAGILPHMFSMTFNPLTGKLYVPLGATAVNGSHGAALTVFDIQDFHKEKIRTGWAPVDLIQIPGKESFLVVNSEDQFAEVYPNGTYQLHTLPYDYPRKIIQSPQKNRFYLSYGPHQSYWPNVYIWAAKNGILEIEYRAIETSGHDSSNFQYFDRRIARLAQDIALDSTGALWGLQNSWGKENLFLTYFPEGIRLFVPQKRMELPLEIVRETTPRILKYDPDFHKLYVVKLGETDDEPGKLIWVNPDSGKSEHILNTGLTPTDLIFDKEYIYISNFDDHTISKIHKNSGEIQILKTGSHPLRLAIAGNELYVINHSANTLQRFGKASKIFPIPYRGNPDNLFELEGKLYLTSHDADALRIISFDPAKQEFELLHTKNYPYGETTFDTNNSSFFTRGQFGDAIFSLTQIRADQQNQLWISDFLSGKVFIIPIKEG
ncbi:MAG: hypothetical protein Kow0042_07970 [Calditrichia bacterium]